jgi:hypothetical protein
LASESFCLFPHLLLLQIVFEPHCFNRAQVRG